VNFLNRDDRHWLKKGEDRETRQKMESGRSLGENESGKSVTKRYGKGEIIKEG
jgi:hypothetical protein